MLINKEKIKIGITDIALLVVSLLFVIGIFCIFPSCPAKEDGAYMTCHWAGTIIEALALLSLALSVAHLVLANRMAKAGLSVGITGVAVLAAIVPNHIVSLCMMHTMACHARMTPGAIAVASVLAACAAFDFILNYRKGRQQ